MSSIPPVDFQSNAAWRLWGIAAAFATVLYCATMNPGAQWQDSGWQQLRIVAGEIDHPSGLALTHPLQFWLGRIAIHLTGWRPATATTLVSALAAAFAVANIAAVCLLIWRDRIAALIATSAFMLAHTFWQFATHTESYALVIALLTCEWLILASALRHNRPHHLWLLGLVNGLGVANHLLAGLSTPLLLVLGLSLWRQKRIRPGVLVVASLAWVVGASPYWWLVAGHWMASGDLAVTIRSALVGDFGDKVFNTSLGLRVLILTAGYVIYNFPNLIIPLAFFARRPAERRLAPLWWLLLAQVLIFGLFVIRYTITDQYTYFLPIYALLTVLAAGGLAHIRSSWTAGHGARRARLITIAAAVTTVWTPLIYLAATETVRANGWIANLVRNKPYRDGYRALLLPWGRGQDYADRLNWHLRELAGDDGLILMEDSMQAVAVRYAIAAGELSSGLEVIVGPQVDEARRSAAIASVGQALRAARPVILSPLDRDRPVFEPDFPGWRLERSQDLYIMRPIEQMAEDGPR